MTYTDEGEEGGLKEGKGRGFRLGGIQFRAGRKDRPVSGVHTETSMGLRYWRSAIMQHVEGCPSGDTVILNGIPIHSPSSPTNRVIYISVLAVDTTTPPLPPPTHHQMLLFSSFSSVIQWSSELMGPGNARGIPSCSMPRLIRSPR